jgi:ribonuclease H2 subunit C
MSSVPQPTDDSDDDEDEPSEPVKIFEHVSDVKEITVWGHDQMPATDDAYHKGVDEWLAFAQTIHAS